jgi:hypothetical protein
MESGASRWCTTSTTTMDVKCVVCCNPTNVQESAYLMYTYYYTIRVSTTDGRQTAV